MFRRSKKTANESIQDPVTTKMSAEDNLTEGDRPVVSRRVRRLRSVLAESRQLHTLENDPHLAAVRLERFRISVTRGMWFFLALGLGYTTTGVHDFLAGKLTLDNPLWWGAWLIEPALAGILINLLRWEAQMLSHRVEIASKPVRNLKRLLLLATWVMNIWAGVKPSDGHVNKGALFLHVVIPLVVYLLAEVMPVIQARCAQARDRAREQISTCATVPSSAAAPGPATVPSSPVSAASAASRLPERMLTAVRAKASEVAAQGRTLTPADVQEVVKVPAEFAARIAADFTTAPAADSSAAA